MQVIGEGVIKMQLKCPQAIDARDALAKALYR
jgi:hypothetical protein